MNPLHRIDRQADCLYPGSGVVCRDGGVVLCVRGLEEMEMTCQRCIEVDGQIVEMVEKEKRLKALLRSIRIAKTVQMNQLQQQIEEISRAVD